MGIFDKAGNLFSQLTGKSSGNNGPYGGGGRTGYFPPVTKQQKKQTVSGTVRTRSQQQKQQLNPQTNTGRTGAAPSQAQQAFFQTGTVPQNQMSGYQSPAAAQQGQRQPYQQNYQPQMGGTGFQGQQPQGTMDRRGDDTGFGQSPYTRQQSAGSAYQVSNTDYYTQQNSGNFQGYTDDLGRLWRIRISIICLSGLRECYDCIDDMSNGQMVVVNLEKIQDDREKQRCMDLLTGAAYVLGCRTTQLDSSKCLFLFTPGNVYQYMDGDVSQMNSRQHFSRNEPQQTSGGRTYGFNRSRYA